MHRLATSILLLALAQGASAQPAQPQATPSQETPPPSLDARVGEWDPAGVVLSAVPGEGRPFAIRHMACDEVRFVTPTYGGGNAIGWGPESIVVVKNEGGTTGIRFVVDRQSGATVGIQTWKELAGRTVTTLPAAARIDWVNCQDADPMGGIVVEWVDVRSLIPSPDASR